MCKAIKWTVGIVSGLAAAAFLGIFLVGMFTGLDDRELEEAASELDFADA